MQCNKPIQCKHFLAFTFIRRLCLKSFKVTSCQIPASTTPSLIMMTLDFPILD